MNQLLLIHKDVQGIQYDNMMPVEIALSNHLNRGD